MSLSRNRARFSRLAALLIVAFVASLLITTPAFASYTTTPGGTMKIGANSGNAEALAIQSTDSYPSGMKVAHFTNGLSVAGRGDETVSLVTEQAVEEDGQIVSVQHFEVEPPADVPEQNLPLPETWTALDAMIALGAPQSAIDEMKLTPLCPHLDKTRCVQLATTFSGTGKSPGDPIGTWCREIDDNKHRSYGCASRKWHKDGENWNYTSAVSSLTGAGKSWYDMIRLRTTHNYHNGIYSSNGNVGQIEMFRPVDDLANNGDCFNKELSLTYQGVGLKQSGTVCRSKWDMTTPQSIPDDAHSVRFTNSWYQSMGVERQDRNTIAEDAIKTWDEQNAGFGYKTSYIYCVC